MSNFAPDPNPADFSPSSAASREIGFPSGNNSGLEFDYVVQAAESALAELGHEFPRGEVPPESMARLTLAVQNFDRLARSGELPAETIESTARKLVEGIREVASRATAWMEATVPTLDAWSQREQVRRAYIPRGM